MAVYATYTQYTTDYLGTAIATEAEFNRLALRASKVIDGLTFNRAAAVVTAGTDTDSIEAIMMATCAVAEALHAENGSGDRVVQSERVGNYSVTYADSNLTPATIRTNAAALWLAETGLMFRGFNSGEYSGSSDED